MEPVLTIKLGDEQLSAAHLSVQDMVKVKTWTGLKSRREFFNEILAEDPEALLAAYCVAKAKAGEDVRLSDADFDLDTLDVTLTDGDGRAVEPLVKRDKAGEPVLDDKGQPIPMLDKAGAQKWVYTDSGDPVPPTETASTPT